MDLQKMLGELRSELENLDAAILSLERLQRRKGRRGRPPTWLAEIKKPGQARRPKKSGGHDGAPEKP